MGWSGAGRAAGRGAGRGFVVWVVARRSGVRCGTRGLVSCGGLRAACGVCCGSAGGIKRQYLMRVWDPTVHEMQLQGLLLDVICPGGSLEQKAINQLKGFALPAFSSVGAFLEPFGWVPGFLEASGGV